MPTYTITLSVEAANLRDASDIAFVITDPGAQVADVARQMGATLGSAQTTLQEPPVVDEPGDCTCDDGGSAGCPEHDPLDLTPEPPVVGKPDESRFTGIPASGYKATHVSISDDSTAMALGYDGDAAVLMLVNEDGYSWTDTASEWRPIEKD